MKELLYPPDTTTTFVDIWWWTIVTFWIVYTSTLDCNLHLLDFATPLHILEVDDVGGEMQLLLTIAAPHYL